MEGLIKKEREMQREERRKQIMESKYNREYKWIMGEGVPGYLKKGWGESRWQRVAKYRLGNGMRGSRYWEGEENRSCRMCGNGSETWEHVWEVCRLGGRKGVAGDKGNRSRRERGGGRVAKEVRGGEEGE